MMYPVDKVVFGDNQFFGINHMSHEKANQLSEKFFNISAIFKIYDIAIDCGVRAIMLNSNDRANEICSYFKDNKSRFPELSWYPSIPYPHKYANLISEKGILPAINEILIKDSSAFGILGLIAKGGVAYFTKDAMKVMQMLVDIEMKMFAGLKVKVIFLQNILTDLLLGFGIKDVFYEYSNYVRSKYKVVPGFITQNLPFLKAKLEEWGIDEVIICTSFNKIGYLMSPDIDSYVETTRKNDIRKFQIMAMSTLASGAIPPNEAYAFINKQKVQSVVFGASSRTHIEETVKLISLK